MNNNNYLKDMEDVIEEILRLSLISSVVIATNFLRGQIMYRDHDNWSQINRKLFYHETENQGD